MGICPGLWPPLGCRCQAWWVRPPKPPLDSVGLLDAAEIRSKGSPVLCPEAGWQGRDRSRDNRSSLAAGAGLGWIPSATAGCPNHRVIWWSIRGSGGGLMGGPEGSRLNTQGPLTNHGNGTSHAWKLLFVCGKALPASFSLFVSHFFSVSGVLTVSLLFCKLEGGEPKSPLAPKVF